MSTYTARDNSAYTMAAATRAKKTPAPISATAVQSIEFRISMPNDTTQPPDVSRNSNLKDCKDGR